ncbi:hypothetical protein KSP39_PZI018389 [Platanthera zijinensis]|uniref:Uncharacterized protein n=1 Tax=Platanthera zijinensis TaxID=2320716 RepID=A0AAP0FZH8_9ASPA
MVDWVESDRCVAACGANCRIVRISSDALLVLGFMEKLCSPECYDNCPNITDLYYNHAAGEGGLPYVLAWSFFWNTNFTLRANQFLLCVNCAFKKFVLLQVHKSL